ncbi:MAG: VCBS repeat-containing protein [Cyclobacteriaceae bacterium]|nr:VCBS repeat-containing protein [Cyclobacteriaceae bacterium]
MGQYTKILDFAGSANGSVPNGGLIIDGTYLYGLTRAGGLNDLGTIFRVRPDGTGYQKLHDFNGTNGSHPMGSLLSAGGFLFGVASSGGANGSGTVFRILPDGSGFTKLIDFAPSITGGNPLAGLETDGTFLYGTTNQGGSNLGGTIYRLLPDGSSFSVIWHFGGSSDGYSPYAALLFDGTSLFGTTSQGGAAGDGNIFRINPDGTAHLVLHDFLNEENPRSGLTADGTTLYGMTFGGGATAQGTVFRIQKDGSGFSTLLEFDGTTGATPTGRLTLQGSTLYGMTRDGGVNNLGVAFSIKTDGSLFLPLIDFDSDNGKFPLGDLLVDGSTLYGMTSAGGLNDLGVTFSYSIASSCVPAAQRNALIALYNATDGANWTDNTGWLSADESTWYGVSVTGCDITGIALDGNNLVGTIPPELGDLTALETLEMGVNQLSGGIPPELGNLANLIDLNLAVNQLTGSVPMELANLSNLQALALSNNQLSGNLPIELQNLSSLQFAFLGFNQFTGDAPAVGLSSPAMSILQLQFNRFTGVPDFTAYTAISLINVANNQLTFGDLEPYMGVAGLTYSPQAMIPPGGVISFVDGGPLSIPFTTDGNFNSYQWFRNNLPIPGATSSSLMIGTATAADVGSYHVEITNSIVPLLTLRSFPYTVITDPCPPSARTAGDLDATFAPLISVPSFFYGVDVQSTGKIITSTSYTIENSIVTSGVLRFNADGSRDNSFASNTHDGLFLVLPDDRIIATYADGTYTYPIRLDANGNEDAAFNANVTQYYSGNITALARQPDDKILVAATAFNTPPFVERFNTDGTSDGLLAGADGLDLYVIKVQSDGHILLGGQFPGGITRLDPTGAVDPTFSVIGASDYVTDIALQTDGKILVAGAFPFFDDLPHYGIVRLNTDGSIDNSFTALGITDLYDLGSSVFKIIIQPDDKIILAGSFLGINGTERKNLVRLNPDGTVDCAFNPGVSSDAAIQGIALQSDGKILITGSFTSYESTTRNGLARVNGGVGGPPTITSFNPASGKTGEVITITGTNFSPIPAGNIVYFGATKTTVSVATPTQLTVTVPPGATFEPITATVGGLTAYSPTPFIPTFTGGNPIVAASFAAHVDFSNSAAPRSINIGDLDGDGLADMVVSSQSGTTGIISVFRNTSTPGAITAGSFAPPFDLVKLGAEREGMSLADIDGDGKLEILAVDVINNRLSVYLNLSTPGTLNASSFDSPQEFNVGILDAPTNVDVEDLDADGLPDVVTADFNRDRITIVRNISSPGVIAFEPRFYILAGDGAADIAIRDLNNDRKPDLAIANELGNSVSVLENVSVAGTLEVASFSAAVNFAVDVGPTKISIGDIDGDGSQDIITANLGTSNTVSILRNILTGGPINPAAFASAVHFTTAGPNNSVELADLNGDGKIDIATAMPSVSPEIAVLQNASTPGNLVLNPFVGFDAGVNTFEVALGDLDNDGMTDIATANNGDNSVSVLRFNTASTLTITLQPSDAIVCEGATAMFNTAATGTTNITYQWQFSPDGIVPFVDIADGGGYSGVSTASLSVNTTGSFGAGRYQCRINGDLAAEVLTSDEGLFINPLPLAPGATGSSVCGGGTVALTATGATDGEYRWYTVSSGGSPIAGAVNAAFTTPVLTVTTTYHVSIHNGTCESATRTPVTATVYPVPGAPGATGSSSCTPASLTLTATGASNGQYRWYTAAIGGSPLAGETNDTYVTPALTVSTTYHVAINDGNCESARTAVTASIIVVAKPTVVTSNCTAVGATLIGPTGFAAYNWSDGSSTQQINVTVAGSYTLTVTSSAGCVSPPSDPVTFTPAFCNQPPAIQPTPVTTTVQSTVTVNISSISSDLDNNIDLSTLKVITQPYPSGATAFINANFELVVDYSTVIFAGTDQLTVELCDVAGACVQEVITIEVAGDITVYNAVSPNGDGKNDVLYIQYIDALPDTQQNRLTILNRWGSVVFEANNYDNANTVFRGLSSSGSELPSGTYYYVLEFSSGAPKRTGFISLRR